MLGKLKRKFVLINMFLVGLVLLLTFSMMCFNAYQTQKEAVNRSLYQGIVQLSYPYADIPETSLSSPSERFNSRSSENHIAAVAVTLNGSASTGGNYIILQSQAINMTMEDEVLYSALDNVLAQPTKEGYISELNLFYLRTADSGTVKIALADGTHLNDTMRQTMSTAIMIFIISMLGLFLISLLLSTMAIRPVKKAWTQQRQFVADASHELKTPLTVILANNNILLSHKEDSVGAQKQWIESTDVEARHMHKLVEDMLFLAKSDAAALPLDLKVENLSELTWNTFLQFEPVAYEKGVELSSDIQENLHLLLDSSKTRQLLHILMDNGCKYADNGGNVKLSLKEVKEGAQIEVHNTGTPIPEADLPHIFERFYRADKVRTIGDGYGLGLSIAKSIVDQMGGSIAVTSSVEDGTTFSVIIPRGKKKSGGKNHPKKKLPRKKWVRKDKNSFRDDEMLF